MRRLRHLIDTLRTTELILSLWNSIRQQAWWILASTFIGQALNLIAQIPWQWWILVPGTVVSLVLAIKQEAKQWKQLPSPPAAPAQSPQPKVTPRGGRHFVLELRYSVTATHIGYGWIEGKGVQRESLFHLQWEGTHHKNEGEIATIQIAEYSGFRMNEMQVWGESENGSLQMVHKSKVWNSGTDWIKLRVEIQAHRFGKWEYKYRFRMKNRREFEVKEINE